MSGMLKGTSSIEQGETALIGSEPYTLRLQVGVLMNENFHFSNL